MKIRHSHGTTFTFIFILSLCIPFFSLATDTITPTQPLTFKQTLVSKNDFFELGFFDLAGKGSYLGIWFKQMEPKTYVWVANRDSPITSSSPKLTVAGNVVLVDDTGATVWSTNQSVPVGGTTVVQLLDSGNLVLRYENNDTLENYIWESFDFPTDTLLPEMKLGWSRKTGINRVMRSWKNKNDPGIGDFLFEMNLNGFPEIVLSNKETKTKTLRSGPSGVPEMKVATIMKFKFEETSNEITYSFKMMNSSIISRLVLDSSGNMLRYIWVVTTKSWSLYWSFPRDMCDRYGECGPFGVCDVDSSPICKCLRGFRPRFRQAWVNLRDGSGGCVRSSELECGSDGFLLLKNVKLPDGSRAVVDRRLNLSECEEVCRRNCNCTAYASMDSIGFGCVIWAVELMDTRQMAGSDSGEQDLYVRVAASDLEKSTTTGGSKNGSGNGNQVVKIVAIVVGSFLMIITLLILFYLKRKDIRLLKKSMTNRKGKRSYYGRTRVDELELPLFDFTTLAMATDNFSDANKLGEGGFGCVYKGTLTAQEVVAVKRLSRVSDQGIEELINEVLSIAKLQHKNLVRLVGCCIEVEEKLLIYEFVENKSLDTFLFDKEKSAQLNWQVRLNIICGIARGILYLHQDSRFKIIHRDLKASNVLLDNKMNPKISDFGMARIFGSDDQTEAKTKRVVGTYGYMSPEYAMDGHFSTKSDVFSFGVLILEIVIGQKNKGSSYNSGQLNLLSHTWTLWKEAKALELVDESLRGEFSEDEALRCIQIGLLCVQEQPKDRPGMSKVLMMLDNETTQLPKPKYPGFFFGKRHITEDSSSKKEDSTSLNEVTITTLDGR